jgi:hypothetical protein
MLKVVVPHGYGAGEPVARLIDVHSRGVDRSWMQKRAAVLTKELAQLRPEKEHTFIHAISMGAQEAYGCFAAGTPMALPDGRYIEIDDIVEHDLVLSGEGNQRPVTHLVRRKASASIKLKVSSLPEPLVSSDDHPYRVARAEQFVCARDKYKCCLPPHFGSTNICQRGNGCNRTDADFPEIDTEWAEARTLRLGDFLVCTLPTLPVEDDIGENEAYLLGAWLAEGCLQKNSSNGEYSSLRLSTGPHEPDFRVRIRKNAELAGWNVAEHDQIEARSEVVVCVTGNAERARWIGCQFGHTARTKRVPAWLCSLPASVRWSFIAGYVDGDGHCVYSDKGNRATCRTASRDLALGMQRLCWSVGMPATICPVRGDGHYNLSFSLAYAGGLNDRALKYHPAAMDTVSKVHGFYHDGRMYLPVRGIEAGGELDVFNFGVDVDHTYAGPNVDSHNCNRNGDGFNEKSAKFEHPEPEAGNPGYTMLDGGLTQYHKTFTKYAKLYKDHRNKDPDLASGSIIAEAYNPDMRRGELIIKASNDKWAPELEKLARGDDIAFSMSCKVPFDICSICGHKAANRREYCDHLSNEMGQVKASGHQVFAINDRPLFFDFSGVFRPADRIAYGLRKVASAGVMPEESIPSAQLAELWGISAPRSVLFDGSPRPVQEKLAAMERLASMEKQIEATGHAISPEIDAGCPMEAIPDGAIDKMRGCDLNDLMGALSTAEICLPIKDFFRLVLGNKYDSVAGEIDSARSLLPGIFSRMLDSGNEVEDVTGARSYDPGTSLIPREVRDIIENLKPSQGLGQGPVGRRVTIAIVRKPKNSMRMLKGASDRSGMSKVAKYLAKQYATYQLAFTRAAAGANDDLVTGLTVFQNYVE